MKRINLQNFHFKQFSKAERSSFQYWYYHWKAFNLVALSLGTWKVKYLFHDIEKPWLKLFWDYKKVQKWHREHNSHHAEYKGGINKIDWEGMVIDNECSRYTKSEAPMTAREWYDYCIANNRHANAMKTFYLPVLEKLGL